MLKPLLLSAWLLAVLAGPVSLHAQDASRPKPDSAKPSMMEDHMMGPWKEMNAFHRVMATTWHPAQKGDVAPLKAKAKELLGAAESWSASNPPSMPATCGDSAVRAAVKKVVADAKALVDLVDNATDDARLKAGLKSVHDTFEIAEKGCSGHGGHGQAG